VWESGAKSIRKVDNRTSDLKCYCKLSDFDNIQLYSLQKEVKNTDLQICNSLGMVDLGSRFSDFTDTAAALANLDLLLSVDTGVLHLAGAMGVKAYGLLAYLPDWRYFVNSDKCMWYSSVKLFHQKHSGDWQSCLDQVYEAMEQEF